jgi:isoleucyl-tRNA synthetase
MITASPVWMPLLFEREGIKEAQRKLMATLENIYGFLTLYANLDRFDPADPGPAEPDLLDRWILSRLQTVVDATRADLEALNLTRAGKTLGAFVVDDLSNWYVRLARRRFWKGEMTPDKRSAFRTLFEVLDATVRALAPFVPFVAEELYRGLHAFRDPAASVHLTDYPVAEPSRQDAALERRMALAQAIVGIGRSLRQEAKLRTRQPLGRLLVRAADGRAAEMLADDRLVAYVAEELNVKAVEALEDPALVSRLSAKPNYRALGSRFGRRVPEAAARISAMTAEEIGAFQRDGRISLDVGGEATVFAPEELQVRQEGVPPFVAGAQGGLLVALDTTLDDELRAEGLAREIVNRIQNLRKKSGLAVSDRIRLSVAGDDTVRAVLERHGERISGETLAVEIAADTDLPYQETFKVDGVEIDIALDRV